MNEQSHNPQIETELEARIAALVLGEASDFERDQLLRLIAERPELAELKVHFEAVHGLLREVGTGELIAVEADNWKLPTDKRDAVLAVLDGESLAQSNLVGPAVCDSSEFDPRATRVSIRQSAVWKFSKIAAVFCVAACLGVLAMSGPFLLHLKDESHGRELASNTFDLSTAQPAEGWNATAANGSRFALPAIRESLSATEFQESSQPSSQPSSWYSNDGLQRFGSNSGLTKSNPPMGLGESSLLPEKPANGPVASTESAGRDLAEQHLQRQFGDFAEAKEVQNSHQQVPAGPPLVSGGVYRYRDESADGDVGSGGLAPGMGMGMGMGDSGYGGSGGYESSSSWAQNGAGQGHFAGDEPAASDRQQLDASSDFTPQGAAQAPRPTPAGSSGEAVNQLANNAPVHDFYAESLKEMSDQIELDVALPSPNIQPLPRADSKKTVEPAEPNTASTYEINIGEVATTTLDSQLGRSSVAAKGEAGPDSPAEKVVLEQALTEEVRLHTIHQNLFGLQPELLSGGSSRLQFAPVNLGESNTADEAFSTFSLHVSDVSFKLAQAALASGKWPEAAQLRIEEFVNAFDYGDPLPSSNDKVACRVEQAVHPFVQQRNVLRISLRTAATGRASNTPLRLTFLLDNSGSMERADRQQTVRRCFAMLARQLTPLDQVTLISFARQPRLLADQVSGEKAEQLVELIEDLPSEGGTNIEAALQLAFEKAREQQTAGAQSRVIMLTDGAVNLGSADPGSLAHMITTIRDTDIAFDAAGISADGLNDEILEALTRKGDGRYYLLDSDEAADDGFARQIAGALRPSAKNVKVQVEFNPQRVGRYQLLGFEKHILKREDFQDDNVDAAEMAAAEAGVAVYQFEAKADGTGDVGSVSVRFRDLATGQMVENRWPIPYEADAPRLEQADPALRLATSAALLAAKLRGDPLAETVELKTLSDLIAGLPERVRQAPRVEQLRQMVQQARQISGK